MRISGKVLAVTFGLLAAAGAITFFAIGSTRSYAASGYRDCSAGSIITCGALTQNELLQKYDQNNDGLQDIYTRFGIMRSDITGETSEIKMGSVNPDGSIVVDGKVVATGVSTTSRTPESNSRRVSVGNQIYYETEDLSGFSNLADVFVMMRDGNFYRAILGSSGRPSARAWDLPPCPEEPIFFCDSLTIERIEGTTYKLTTKATTTKDYPIVDYTYTFGDGARVTTPNESVTHQFKTGTYKVKVTINIRVGTGRASKVIKGASCEKTITVTPPPVTPSKPPVYACNSLTAKAITAGSRTFAYTLDYTAKDGAILQKADYDFGDSMTATYSAAEAAKAQHTYAADGTYRTVATLYFNVTNGDDVSVKTAKCEVAVQIVPKKCTVPGKEDLTEDDLRCMDTPTTPTEPETPPAEPETPSAQPELPAELPQTGVTSLLGGSIGIGMITAAGYYWAASRKAALKR